MKPQNKYEQFIDTIKGWGMFLFVLLLIFIVLYSWYSVLFKSKAKEEFTKVDCSLQLRDGDHCAQVTYYNPNTGTKRKYTLMVEVSSNELIKIYWPNGGWLDDFDYVEFDDSGSCSLTSEKGYEYEIQINGEICDY